MNFVTMMALGFPMQFFFEILGQPYFPFFLVFCESLLSSLRSCSSARFGNSLPCRIEWLTLLWNVFVRRGHYQRLGGFPGYRGYGSVLQLR
jgi:hypothetical protein